MPATYSVEKKKEIGKKAFNTLILSLGDKVLREVLKMKTTAELWLKLESLYMTKSLSSKLYLKAKFLTFKMNEGQRLQDHIDDFNQLCLDLENIEVKYVDEDKALVLLHSLPKSYETFVDILQHDRDTLTLHDVIGALNSKELQQKVEGKNIAGDVLSVKSRPDRRDPRQRRRYRSRSKNSRKIIKCYHCHEKEHIKKNCPKKKKKFLERNNSEISSSICEFDYDSVDALVMFEKADKEVWILDLGCSFHMSP